MLAGFNEFGFNESSRFNELIFDLKYFFLLHKSFGFNEYPGLMNYLLGPERFVKSGDHCIALFRPLFSSVKRISLLDYGFRSMMSARHPLDRLYSAFRDKFLRNSL